MRVPQFDTNKIGLDISELIDLAPTRSVYEAVFISIDTSMDDLLAIREEVKEDSASKELLTEYDSLFEEFGEREAHYYKSYLESESREVVDAPLFKGDYSSMGIDGPGWPDIQTPWRLANLLSKAAYKSGAKQSELDSIKEKFEAAISEFWGEAHSLISKMKEQAEAESETDGSEGGRSYGFLPALAVGAVGLVAALSAAGGYAAARKDSPTSEYVQTDIFHQEKKDAKMVGIGIAAGITIAALFAIKNR